MAVAVAVAAAVAVVAVVAVAVAVTTPAPAPGLALLSLTTPSQASSRPCATAPPHALITTRPSTRGTLNSIPTHPTTRNGTRAGPSPVCRPVRLCPCEPTGRCSGTVYTTWGTFFDTRRSGSGGGSGVDRWSRRQRGLKARDGGSGGPCRPSGGVEEGREGRYNEEGALLLLPSCPPLLFPPLRLPLPLPPLLRQHQARQPPPAYPLIPPTEPHPAKRPSPTSSTPALHPSPSTN